MICHDTGMNIGFYGYYWRTKGKECWPHLESSHKNCQRILEYCIYIRWHSFVFMRVIRFSPDRISASICFFTKFAFWLENLCKTLNITYRSNKNHLEKNKSYYPWMFRSSTLWKGMNNIAILFWDISPDRWY